MLLRPIGNVFPKDELNKFRKMLLRPIGNVFPKSELSNQSYKSFFVWR